jgi:hypothetical protein
MKSGAKSFISFLFAFNADYIRKKRFITNLCEKRTIEVSSIYVSFAAVVSKKIMYSFSNIENYFLSS